jgi:hypothetical protein
MYLEREAFDTPNNIYWLVEVKFCADETLQGAVSCVFVGNNNNLNVGNKSNINMVVNLCI